jgi:two-component system, NtrC family, sensor histidine kinase HydH
MPDGGEIVLCATTDSGLLQLEVRDQGSGIPEANLERIFNPFFTTREEGTGLGLSIADRIVSQHGGSIKVRLNPDRGTTFAVVLPLVPAEGQNALAAERRT